jgi:enoyl-CoA hydratase
VDAAEAVRVEDDGAVRSLVLCRPAAYNTITPALRDQLAAALDAAEDDRAVRVVLLRAEGPAFCAGFGLDWATAAQARDAAGAAPWDSMADLRGIGRYAETFAKLHRLSKPTIAAVQGWCIAGGTDLVLNADIVIASETARFGYPPARVWGIPEAPWLWVARLGLERAKRYLLTGDEIDAGEAARIGLVAQTVADDALLSHTSALARRMARLPLSQLQMIKLSLNDVARRLYDPEGSRLVGCLFDGVARHSPEGAEFVTRAGEVGWRQAVRERDEPFGDYGSRPRT